MKYTHTTVLRGAAVRRTRIGLLIPMLIFVGLLVALYAIKAQTLAAKSRVSVLEQSLVHERQVVQMLAAEIAHLENPKRLRALAAEQLDLQPTPTERTLTLEQAAQKLAQGSVKVSGGKR